MSTWTIARSFDHAYIRDIEDEDGETIAQVLDLDDYPNDIKRAKLIAAAPDLLAALSRMLQQFADHAQYDEHDSAAIECARAAIAKVERGIA